MLVSIFQFDVRLNYKLPLEYICLELNLRIKVGEELHINCLKGLKIKNDKNRKHKPFDLNKENSYKAHDIW